MAPGVAEYRSPGEAPYRVFVNEDAIKHMDKTFDGRPVYVGHVDEVDFDKRGEIDGYVVKSFYNAVDGKHWVEFMVISDEAKNAIKSGWRLSNAYVGKSFGPSGVWHGLDYTKEIVNGEYDHLAIVRNPRYDESVILTPDQFKNYNESKALELKRLANSKEQGEKSVLKLFKKTKVENSSDFDEMMVTLPVSKLEMTLTQIVNELDVIKNMHGYANMDHMVKMADDKEMSVKELMDCYGKMNSEMEEMKKNMAEKDMGEKDAEKDKKAADKTENVGKDGGEKEAEADKKAADKTENEIELDNEGHFKALQNAEKDAQKPQVKVDLDKVARGKARYS